MKKTLFFELHFLLLFLISSCGIDITVVPKIIPGASNVFSPVSVSSPAYTNSTTINLTYGNSPADYLEYCLLENDVDVLNCSWVAGTLPSTFLIDATEEVKVISTWIRNLEETSERVDSNQIVLDTTNPVLSLTSLNGGQSLLGGVVASITWTGSDLNPGTTPMRLEYSSDNGATWNVIENAISNSGSYNWTVPSVTSILYLVRVTMTDLAGNFVTESSTTNFLVNATSPVITVTAPNGGQLYRGGSSRSITWTTSGLPAGAASIKLEYTTDGTFYNLISGGETNDGTYSWSVPVIDSATVKIKATVTDSFAAETTDESNTNFEIDSTAPSAPAFLALETPSTTPAQSNTPIIRISGVSFGNIVNLYANSSCSSPSFKGSTTAAGVTADVTSLSVGSDITISFYATQTDPAGNESVCSTAFVDYTRDTTSPILASATVTNSSPTPTTTYNLTYGAVTGTYTHYCIRENNTTVSGCTWVSGVLPATFSVTAFSEAKVLSIWLRDFAGNVSARVDTNSVILNLGGNAPVANNLIPTSFDEDTEELITLVYNDGDGDLATTCALSSLVNVTETTACSCTLGTCTVGVTGTLNYFGSASFNYTVTAAAQVSNAASGTLTIDSVDDAPTISDIADQTTDLNTATSAIGFLIGDVDDAITCADVTGVSSLTSFVANSSIVIAGTAPNCTVTLTPENNETGLAVITLTITKNGLTNQDTFSLFVNGVGWYQEAYVKAANNDAGDNFGRMTSLSGDNLAVGASLESSNQTTITNGATASGDNSNGYSGAVYLYKRTGSSWVQEAYIKAINNDADDGFGYSTSLSGDTLAVGALGEDSNQTTITNGATASLNNSIPSTGAVYIFKRTGSSWTQEAYIKAVNNGPYDIFGSSTSLSGDTLAVGALGEDSNQTTITNGGTASTDNSNQQSGAVYIYKRTGSSWIQEAYIKAVNNNISDQFGANTSLSGDTLAVGASNEDSNQTTITNGTTASTDNSGSENGAIYIYKRTGNSWTQEAYIKSANNDANDQFGQSTSLSGDTLAVGVPSEDSNQTTITNGATASGNNSNSNSGAVYLYKRTESLWAQEAYIKSANNDSNDNFGVSTSLSGDTLAVGARSEDSNQTTITNGATASGNNSNSNSGAVYVYKRTGSSWAQEAYLKASNNDASDSFGYSTSLSGDTLAVGANFESSNQTTITNGTSASSNNSNSTSGAVYIYRNNARLFDPSEFISSANSISSITLTWSQAGLKATGYKIAYNLGLTPPANCSLGTVVDVGNVLTTTISGLLSSAFYSFRICSYDATLTMAQGYTSTFNTASATPEITNLSLTPSLNTIDLTWSSGGGTTTGFVIAYQTGFDAPADCSSGTVVDVGNVTTYSEGSLSPSTQYAFRVCSYDGLMTNSFGVTGTTRTLDLGWNQEAYIKAVNGEATDYFGSRSSLSGDTLAVGAYGEDSNQTTITNGSSASTDNSNALSGAVYVYKRSGTTWTQEAYIKAVNSDANDRFGNSLSLSGETLAVGSFYEASNQTSITNGTTASSNNSIPESGAVYVYKRTGSAWAQEAYIKAVNNNSEDRFGYNVSLSGDTLAVGVVQEDSNQTTITNGATASSDNSNFASGAVYLYKRSGSSWTQQAYIKATNNNIVDAFGISLSLSGDSLSVGASNESSNQVVITNGINASSDNSNNASGAVYVYRRLGNTWFQEAYIKAANNNANDFFGYSTSLSGDLLSVGAYQEDSNQTTITNGATASADNSNTSSGAVYIYKRNGISWTQEAYIKAANSNTGDVFGFSTSLSGNTLVVGAYAEDSSQITITNGVAASADNSKSNTGAVYVYKRTGSAWAQEAYIKAANSDSTDLYGSHVDLSGDTIVVGASVEDSNQSTITNGTTASADNSNSSSGAVYVYRNNARLFDPPEFVVSARNLTSLTLSWNQAGQKTVGYKIAYSLGSTPPADCSVGTVVDVGNVLTTTISPLTYASQYSFRICSYDVSNNLSQGVTSSFYTETYSPEVLSFTASPTKYTTTLNWTSGGGATAGFKIAYQTGTTAPNDCASGTVVDVGNVSTHPITGLTPATNYAFRICSYDGSNRLSIGMTTNTTTLDGWEQEAYIKAVNASANDYFGHMASLSGDTLAVGAYGEDSNQTSITNGATASSNDALSSSGAVYIYKRSGSTWTQEAYIKAINSDSGDNFGAHVHLNGDTLAVQADQEDSSQTTITNGATASSNNTLLTSGAVYIYVRSGSTWSQQAYIKASNANADDTLGICSISGNTLAVGAFQEDSNQSIITNGTSAASSDNSLTDSGAVYIYSRSGATWTQQAYIKAKNVDAGDEFGRMVSLSEDSLVVAARYEDSGEVTITNGTLISTSNTSADQGAAYVYRRSGASWNQEAYIKSSNGESGDNLGYHVSLSGDTLAVGSYLEDSNQTTITNGSTASTNNSNQDSGAVYVYSRTGTTWSQQAYLKASNSGSGDFFGFKFSLSGNSLVVGAYLEDSNQTTITNGSTSSSDNSRSNSGAVYVYRRSGTTWSQEAYIKAVNGDISDRFGWSVGLSGDSISVTAPYESSQLLTITNGLTASSDNSRSQSGAVYIYRDDNHLYDPSEFFSTAKTTTSLTLAWRSAGAKATGYKLFYNVGLIPPAACFTGTQFDAGSFLTAEITGLSPSTYYSFRICTYDALNNITEGYTTTFHTALASPEILSISSTEAKRSITLNWTSGGGATTGFKIARSLTNNLEPNCSNGTVVDVGNVSTYEVTSLTPGTDYYFKICSYDVTNVESLGISYQARTLELGWEQQAYIKAANNDAGDFFGSSTSLSTNTLAVGTSYESSNQSIITNGAAASGNNSNTNSGAVYVYKRTGSSWAQEAYIKAVNNDANDLFGGTISLSGDSLAVGARWEDSNQTTITNGATASGNNSNSTSGAVYVYKRIGSSWAQEAYVKAVNNDAGDFFGRSISLSGDTLAVGASGEASNQTTITNGATASGNNSNGSSGAVYIYKRTGSMWAQEAYIKAVNNDAADYFGSSTSLSGDTLAVGAPYEFSNQTTITNGTTASGDNSNNDSGAVYIYKRTGSSWFQEAYLKAVNNDVEDKFGYSTSLSGDTLVVGAINEASDQTTITNGTTASSNNSNAQSGAVYVYKRTGSSWAQEAYVKAANSNSSDAFGCSTSLSGDTLVVGSFNEGSNQTTITNGTTASADNTNSGSGAVYVYKRTGNSWAQEAYIKAVNNNLGDFFGYSLSVNGDTLAVGATGEDSNQITITNGATASSDNSNTDSGAVYIYTNPDRLFDPSDIFYSNQTINSLTLNWSSGGTNAVGYKIAFATGLIAPADCSAGLDVGNVLTYNVVSLGESSQYSFRICSYDSLGNLSHGVVQTFQTKSHSPEVLSLDIITDDNNATLSWTSGGGTTTGFVIAYQLYTPPDHCRGTVIDVLNVSTYQITGLQSGTTYGFRLCSYTGGLTASVGITRLATTTGSAAGWIQEAYIKPFNSEAGDYFGRSVSISGDQLAVGADGEDNGAQTILVSSTPQASDGSDNSSRSSGAVYLFNRTGVNWEPQAYIKSINSTGDQRFGYNVSLVGDQLAVAAIGEASSQTTIDDSTNASTDTRNPNSGAVYLYQWDGTTWLQKTYIKASNSEADDEFGESIIFDGRTLVVGVPAEDSNETTITQGRQASSDNSVLESGAVYIYSLNKNNMVEEAYIKAVNGQRDYLFGNSVSLSGDTIAVGSPGEASNETTINDGTSISTDRSQQNTGAVYIYQRRDGIWDLQSYIKASNADSGDRFGENLSLSGDVLAVGAIKEASNQTTITNGSPASPNNDKGNSGAVYIYSRDRITWSEEAYIKVDNADSGDNFGARLSLSGDTLAVGATREDSNQTTITNGPTSSSDNSSSNSGAVYLFKRVAQAWSQVGYIKPPFNSEVQFGSQLDLSGDTLVVGSFQEASNQTTITNGTTASNDVSSVDSGAVYVYRNQFELFDPGKVRIDRPDSSTLSITWDKAGSQAVSYAISAKIGNRAPTNCVNGDINVTTTQLTYDLTGLDGDTEYSFRICSVDGSSNYSSGVTMMVKTSP